MDHPVDTRYLIIEFSTSLENKGRPCVQSSIGPILLNHDTQSRMAGMVVGGGTRGSRLIK